MTIMESLLAQLKSKGYLSDCIASPHMSPKVARPSLGWGRFTSWVLTFSRPGGNIEIGHRPELLLCISSFQHEWREAGHFSTHIA